MSPRRILALALLAIQVALLALTMGYLPVGVALLLLALVGCVPRLQRAWSLRQVLIAEGTIAALFFVTYQLDLFSRDPFRSAPVDEPASLAGALAMMTMQVLLLFRRAPGAPGPVFPVLAALALAHGADRYLSEPAHLAWVWGCAMGAGTLFALYYSVGESHGASQGPRFLWRRCGALALCLLLSLGLAAGTAWLLRNTDKVVAQWMANQALLQRLGLSNSAQTQLDSVSALRGRNEDRIALQIQADDAPGYLRGQVYIDYEDRTWTAQPVAESAPETRRPPEGYTPLWRDATLFDVNPGTGAIRTGLVVFPSTEIDRALFTPLDTGWLARPGGLQLNRAGVVQSPVALEGKPYQVLTTAPPPPVAPTTEEWERYTRLPEPLAPRLKALAAEITADESTATGKARAIEAHFHGRYDYVLGIQVPDGEDPMDYFLFSDPPPAGHCEFFATGAALLLRAAGVPARYVTGVGVWEQHPFAEYWVARNRDAHAWVEAWDEQEGWFIVEATPSNGLPEAGAGQRTNPLRDLWSLLSLQVRQLIDALRQGAWEAVADSLGGLAYGLYRFIRRTWVPLVAALSFFMVVSRLRRWRRNRPNRVIAETEFARRMQRQLFAMDRHAKRRLKLERAPDVTPHAFAARIEAAEGADESRCALAGGYRAWALLRYQPAPAAEQLARLEATIKALRKRVR